MFSDCIKFDQELNNWSGNKVPNLDTKCQRDVSNVTNMSNMYHGCKKLSYYPKWFPLKL